MAPNRKARADGVKKKKKKRSTGARAVAKASQSQPQPYSVLLDVLGCAHGADGGSDGDEPAAVGQEAEQAALGGETAEQRESAPPKRTKTSVQPELVAEGDGAQWRTDAYHVRYEGELNSEAVTAQRDALVETRWSIAGFGAAALALAPEGATPPAPAPTVHGALDAYGVLPALRSLWAARWAARGRGDAVPARTASLLALLGRYVDVEHTDVALDAYDADGILDALALHVAQHAILATRARQRGDKKAAAAAASGSDAEPPRDRGFTRPTVLVVLPLRSHALAFVRALLDMLPSTTFEQVENKARFIREYDADDGEISASKPADFRALFAGNSDDCFRCAIRLTRKSAKLYAPFYKSDVIVASPLGLRLAMGSAEDAKKTKYDADWLSSIELLVAPYADIFSMQNVAHFTGAVGALNQLPAQTRDTDFSRVRACVLDGHASALRQSVILASQHTPEVRAVSTRACANAAGRVIAQPACADPALASPLARNARQLFSRFDADDPAALADARLRAFRTRVLPTLRRTLESGAGGQTILYVPAYFDFVRLRGLLADEDIPFASLSEYTSAKSVSRARTALAHRELPLLVYTERAHFSRRHHLRGASHAVLYGLPTYAHFYLELLSMLEPAPEAAGECTCVALFCRFDVQPLRRLVGDERAAAMLSGREESYVVAA